MTSPRPTDLNFALPPGFVPSVRPALRTVEAPAPAPAIESTAPVAEPKPRAPRKPRATTTKTTAPTTTAPKPRAPRTTAPKPAAPKATTTRRRSTPAVAEIVEHEAGRILEDAARTAADMLAA